MTDSHWVLFSESGNWLLGTVLPNGPSLEKLDISVEAGPEEVAEKISKRLFENGYTGNGVLLALGSAECLSARFSIEKASFSRSKSTMLYALEESLPLAAEEIAADFSVNADSALGVAVSVKSISPLIDSLESHGVVVQSISPSAMLAVQNIAGSLNEKHPCIVVWGSGEHLDMIVMDQGKPCAWEYLHSSLPSVPQRLQMILLSHAGPLEIVGQNLDEEVLDSISAITPVTQIESKTDSTKTLVEAATLEADKILRGSKQPWFDLRSGAIAADDPYRSFRGLLQFATASVLLLLLSLSAAMLIQHERYLGQADNYRRQQADVFRAVLPDQRLPEGKRSRLESELTKLSGIKGESAELSIFPSPVKMLKDVIESLPKNLRFRLLELRLERGRINIVGEVRSHGDSTTLSQALKNAGYEVDAPRSEQLPGRGVSIHMSAKSSLNAKTQAGGAL